MRLTYVDAVSIKVVILAVIAVVSIPTYFLLGGTILGFILTRIVANFFNIANAMATHRWLSHNSFEASILGRIIMFVSLILGGYGRPIHIVIAHRLHHQYTDTDLDPHSPKHLSLFKSWLGRYRTHRKISLPKDIFKKKEIVFLSKYYWTIFFIFNLIIAIIDFKTALILTPISFSYSWLVSTLLNHYAHKDGLKDYRGISLFLTSGESLHKTHHENQESYHLEMSGYRDPGKKFIDIFLKK